MPKELEITKISWNVHAIQGWFAVVVGLLAMGAQFVVGFSLEGFIFGALGLVGGAGLVTWAGPVRKVSVHNINLRQ